MARGMPWFRVYASETLQSRDLGALTLQEQAVWFRLLCVVALEDPRGSTRVDAHLAAQCMVTPGQLSRALRRMAELGMVELNDGAVTVVNWEKYNPQKPSDAPERVAERQRRSRANRRLGHADVTRDTGVTNGVTTGHANGVVTPHIEKKEERREITDDSLRSSSVADDAFGPEPDSDLVQAMRGIEGLGIPVNQFVAEDVRYYLEEGLNGEAIYRACKRAAGNGVRSWNYVRPILNDWLRNGVPEEDGNGRRNGRGPWKGDGDRAGDEAIFAQLRAAGRLVEG